MAVFGRQGVDRSSDRGSLGVTPGLNNSNFWSFLASLCDPARTKGFSCTSLGKNCRSIGENCGMDVKIPSGLGDQEVSVTNSEVSCDNVWRFQTLIF